MLQACIRSFIFLLSWLLFFLLPNKKQLIIKYLPVNLFSSMLILAEIFYFTTINFWEVKGGKKNLAHTAFLFTFGPYIVLNTWFFHLSKGKFLHYFLLNLAGDLIYAFPIISLFRKLKVFNIKMKSSSFFLLIFTDALLNFGFQKIIEKIYPQTQAKVERIPKV